MNLYLIFCAFSWHTWGRYRCKDSASERGTRRECKHCQLIQERATAKEPWQSL